MSTPSINLRAAFLLSTDGQPRSVEAEGKTHYHIRLSIVNVPENARSATYVLDDSYWNPVREVLDKREDGFPLDITSYGDFDIRASLSGSEAAGTRIQATLSRLLRSEYESEQSESIAKAIDAIRQK